MTPIEVAYRASPGQFKVKGDEIIFTYCPFCGGGQSRDRDTFTLNADSGLYFCRRGKCQEKGNLDQLCNHMGIPIDRKEYEPRKANQKKYTPPKTKAKPIETSEISKYLTEIRKLSKDTCDYLRIGESEGKIVFPYYENGQLVAVKFRAKNQDGKWKQFTMEPGGKLVFWNMDNCDYSLPLMITEGEFDAAALVQAGITNTVSLPNGCESLGCVDLCWEWLKQFKQYYIWTDKDEGGIKARNELIKRLGIGKCLIVEHEKFKDANEVLYSKGIDGIAKCISDAQAIPLVGLKNMAELPEYDLAQDELIPTGIAEVDEAFAGGLRLGETSIWTGFNSSGKSTLLGQILLNSLESGYKICAYSGELPDRIFRYWIELQAAGPEHINQEVNKYGYPVSKTDYKMLPHIRKWYSGRFWLYDSQEVVGQDKILEVFEYAVQRHDCKIFMVDNLMSLALNSHSDSDFYRKQADFIGMCKAFAKNFNVHIHIVAHPRKPVAGSKELDVAGSGNITNWADNVFEIRRFNKKEIASLEANEETKGLNITNSLNIKKNRLLGKQDKIFLLAFEDKSKRYYIAQGGNPNWRYGWVKAIGVQSTAEKDKGWEEIGRVVHIED